MTVTLIHADCLEWLSTRERDSIHAVVTDPPFSVEDFSDDEVGKLRRGSGGVWRQPPSIGGTRRAPLPRFTVLTAEQQQAAHDFFARFAQNLLPVLTPGAHVFIATNPLLSHLVYLPMLAAGFEKRGEVVRLVQTLRGGDRPKGAEDEFTDITVMPRSAWEPWGVFRKPLDGTVAECLRKWSTGALRRASSDRPFTDVIVSRPTSTEERVIAPHPCLKPQAFVRQLVAASLPLSRGVVLDPFMGGGSVVAAASRLGYDAIGVERDTVFYAMAQGAYVNLAEVG